MKRGFTLTVQSSVLAVLIPAVLVCTLVLADDTRVGLQRSITTGFDQKLKAVVSTAAAFIDPEDQRDVYQPRDPSGLALDPATTNWYLYDLNRAALISLDPKTGAATEIAKVGRHLGDIAWHPGYRALFACDPSAVELVRIDPETATSRTVGKLPEPVTALEFDPSSAAFIGCGTNTLFEIDPDSAFARPIAPLRAGGEIAGLAFDANGTLYGIERETGDILLITPNTGAAVRVRTLQEAEADADLRWEFTLPARGMVSDPATGLMYTCGNRFTGFALADGIPSDHFGWTARGYRDHNNPLHLKYAEAMRRITGNYRPTDHPVTGKKEGIKFMYTFVLGGPKDIEYVIDSTPPADEVMFSAVGYPEDLRDTNVTGLRRALVEYPIFVSDFLDFRDQWGAWLKVAGKPIRTRPGEVVGFAGVDIDATIVWGKIRIAVIRVAAVGTAALLVAGFLAFTIARSLSRPINDLKEGALRVAAGDFSRQLEIATPRELNQLAGVFNRISRTLDDTIRQLNRTNEDFALQRCEQEIAKAIAASCAAMSAPAPGFGPRWLGGRAHGTDPSGYLCSREAVIAWVSGHREREFDALRGRHDASDLLSRMWDRKAATAPQAASALAALHADTIRAAIVFDTAASRVTAAGNGPLAVLRVPPAGKAQASMLQPGVATDLRPGERIVVCSAPGLDTAAWVAAAEGVDFSKPGPAWLDALCAKLALAHSGAALVCAFAAGGEPLWPAATYRRRVAERAGVEA